MRHPADIPLVTTIKERCRVCYTCVRECPAKAIRIHDGQAEVLVQRCIGCGNCVRVCSQGAKQILNEIEDVQGLLSGRHKVAACVAPSFPAEFEEMGYGTFVGILRSMGFDYVTEVAFGADLVARSYKNLIENKDGRRYVATSCPALVGFVERYHPALVDCLAPIVSPMVAMARALRAIHGPELKVVFIGPCLAKKGEAVTTKVAGDVDGALTFNELRQMIAERGLQPTEVTPSEFDGPRAGTGALFPISRGMLQAAGIDEDLAAGEVVAADGRSNFLEALREFEAGDLDARLLELLCCNGCIMGAGMTNDSPLFHRRSCVSYFVRERVKTFDAEQWQADMNRFAELDLSREYEVNDRRIAKPSVPEIKEIMERLGKSRPEDELNCGACGYETCRDHAIAIFKGLAEDEMCLPHSIERLKLMINELASTREALINSEKLASMGQLAAGIAHEVNNPLGVVLMFAHLLLEDIGQDSQYREDLTTIVENADRCKKIVSGLLHFARQNDVTLRETNVRELIDHTMKSVTSPERIRIDVVHDSGDVTAEIDRDQIIQVLTNLITNAQSAMPEGGTLTIRTTDVGDRVNVAVSDTGVGIPEDNLKKIFDPFFTTKQVGKGTGLGLAVTYGVVKMHHGDIQVSSNADPAKGPTGTTFTVSLPKVGQVMSLVGK